MSLKSYLLLKLLILKITLIPIRRNNDRIIIFFKCNNNIVVENFIKMIKEFNRKSIDRMEDSTILISKR